MDHTVSPVQNKPLLPNMGNSPACKRQSQYPGFNEVSSVATGGRKQEAVTQPGEARTIESAKLLHHRKSAKRWCSRPAFRLRNPPDILNAANASQFADVCKTGLNGQFYRAMTLSARPKVIPIAVISYKRIIVLDLLILITINGDYHSLQTPSGAVFSMFSVSS